MSLFLRELLSFTSIASASALASFRFFDKLNALYAVFKVLWWAQVDSNHRPHAYQACALTS